MALICCPECNKEISDKAVFCPHCGKPLAESDVTSEEVMPQSSEVVTTGQLSPKVKTKNIIITTVIAAILVGIGIFVYQTNQKIDTHNRYIENLNTIMSVMIQSGAKAETAINLIRAVWYNTIYEVRDIETNKYTINQYDNSFHRDFDTSLRRLLDDPDFKNTLSKIDNSLDVIKLIMKDLQSPPDEFRDCYETLNDLFAAYKSLVNHATHPARSLVSYTESCRNCAEDFVTAYDKLKLQIPEPIIN